MILITITIWHGPKLTIDTVYLNHTFYKVMSKTAIIGATNKVKNKYIHVVETEVPINNLPASSQYFSFSHLAVTLSQSHLNGLQEWKSDRQSLTGVSAAVVG